MPEQFEDANQAERVSAEAYQVIGALADAAGLFEQPEVIRALDYFGYDQWKDAGREILPFGAGLPVDESRVSDLAAENARLRVAFHEAIRRPLGVTPDSGVEFYDARMADQAEQRASDKSYR